MTDKKFIKDHISTCYESLPKSKMKEERLRQMIPSFTTAPERPAGAAGGARQAAADQREAAARERQDGGGARSDEGQVSGFLS